MSRHRRAAPSISAAAPTAPRWSRNARASAGSFASAATAAPSSVTCATRVPGSRVVSGVTDTPGAEASTTYTAGVEPLSAGTRMTSATCAHGTNCLTPLSATFPPRSSARVSIDCGLQSSARSISATVARAPPPATAGSQRLFWAGLPVGAEGKVHGALLGLRHAVGADLLGETEHALADDVLLDLRRARINRARARPQERVRPARAHAGRRVDVERGLFEPAVRHLAVGAEDLEAELVVALLELAVGELGDRRRRAGRRALLERGQHPEGGVPLYFHLRVDVPQLGAHHRILEQRLAAALDLLRGVHETVEGGGIARHARHRVAAALEAERRLRDLPALT